MYFCVFPYISLCVLRFCFKAFLFDRFFVGGGVMFFSLGPGHTVMLYSVFLLSSLPQTPVKTLAKLLVNNNLAEHLVNIFFGKMSLVRSLYLKSSRTVLEI